MADTPEPFADVTRRLRSEAGKTVDDVAYDIKRLASERSIPARSGASVSSFQKHAAGTAEGSPSVTLMELAAEALGAEPSEFVEYRLARARLLLDEREVGLDRAYATLTQVERALAAAPRTRRANAAGRQARSQTPTLEAPREARRQRSKPRKSA